jgi:hypothetical protein
VTTDLVSVLLIQYCLGDSIDKNEMGVACSAYEGDEIRIQGFGGGNLKERDHFGDPGLDGRIIRKWDVRVWTGSSWLRIGTGSGQL